MSNRKWDDAPVEFSGQDVTEFPAEEIRNTWVEFPDCGAIGPEREEADKGRRYLVAYEFAGRRQTVLVYAPNATVATQKVAERDLGWEGETKVLGVTHAPGKKHEDVAPAWSGLRAAAPAPSAKKPCRDCNNRGYFFLDGEQTRCDCEAGATVKLRTQR